ncbi:primosomal protein N' [Nocardiopsis suaedae]|uniref:Probable replication restart protein PriA n=1 Tax=Nocardiopsis suaedae TaxID=3018444 RepID=A0ABT4TT93_9ACTN|nr:primosomal protein N' [Nocardiopsis suaedae]MDA2807666.1 primosomal protein N' [Nocardiopsis suaedae]
MDPQPEPGEGLLFDVPEAGPAADAQGGPAAPKTPAKAGGTSAPKAAKAAKGKKGPKKRTPAEELPIARVAVDTPLPHLDRLFDYQVPADMADDAVPGCRVRVPFHGQVLSGFLIERAAASDFTGRLSYLSAVVSPEPVLTPEIRDLARAVADRYAGTFSDVLRLAVPPRHARVEKEGRTGEKADEAEEPAGSGDTTGEATAADQDDTAAADVSPDDDTPPSTEDEGAAPEQPAAGTPPEATGPEEAAESEAPAAASRTSAPASDAPDAVDAPNTPGAPGAPEAADTGADPEADLSASPSPPAPEPDASEEPTASDAPADAADSPAPDAEAIGPWADYAFGPSFVSALRAGHPARAVWSALPGPGWDDAIAIAVRTTVDAGRGAVVVVPDGRDVAVLDAALAERLGPGRHVALTAELGPAERYRRWLAALRGQASAVVGTRAAMFAPVHDLGLVVLWDDGDDVHADPHAPYPHARTVLTLRAHRAGAAALIGGHTRTAEGARLVESGWAHPLTADRATVRRRAPAVRASGDDFELARDEAARAARLPHLAMRVAREAAAHGPVLVQVPRRGYLASLACNRCRAHARCGSCQGPLALRSAHAAPYCRWCGRIAGDWQCEECGHARVRASVVGDRRTAEELGRAFPSLPVRTSGRDEVLTTVSERPALVVATPGAEPVAEGGYAAALLLDGWTMLGRADLRASEEAARRWFSAAALVRSAEEGGRVVVMADASVPAVQALVRWDPSGLAERELEERRELGFPPAVTMASVTGAPAKVRELLDGLSLPESAEVLGPVPVDAGGPGPRSAEEAPERALLRVPHADAYELTKALKAAAAARSARREEHLAQVRVDPLQVV